MLFAGVLLTVMLSMPAHAGFVHGSVRYGDANLARAELRFCVGTRLIETVVVDDHNRYRVFLPSGLYTVQLDRQPVLSGTLRPRIAPSVRTSRCRSDRHGPAPDEDDPGHARAQPGR